jgi:hypothetical protein
MKVYRSLQKHRSIGFVRSRAEGVGPSWAAASLSLAQVHGALAYCYDHPQEIEGDISDGKRVEAEIERDRALHPKGHSAR